MIDGYFSLANSNKVLTLPSLSPKYLDIKSDDLIEKNVAAASVAHAFAKNVFPVPGGP